MSRYIGKDFDLSWGVYNHTNFDLFNRKLHYHYQKKDNIHFSLSSNTISFLWVIIPTNNQFHLTFKQYNNKKELEKQDKKILKPKNNQIFTNRLLCHCFQYMKRMYGEKLINEIIENKNKDWLVVWEF